MSTFSRNSLVYSLANVIPKVGAFFVLPFITKAMTPSDYGLAQTILSISIFATLLITFATHRSIYKLYYSPEFKNKEKSLFNSIITISLFGFLVSISLGLLLLQFSNQQIFDYPSFTLFSLYIFLNVINAINIMKIKIHENSSLILASSLIKFLIKNALILYFYSYLTNTGIHFFLFALLLTEAMNLTLYGKRMLASYRFHLNIHELRIIFFFSLPIIPSTLAAWGLNLSDRILILNFLGQENVAYYSLSYQLSSLGLFLYGGIKTALDPWFFSSINKANSISDIKKKFHMAEDIMLLFSFLLLFTIPVALNLFFATNYYEAGVTVSSFIIGGLYFQHYSGYFNLYLYQENQTKILMFITIIAAIVGILLNILLLPSIGLIGAGLATMVSFLTSSLLSLYMVKVNLKKYDFPMNISQSTKKASVLLISVIIVSLLKSIMVKDQFHLLIFICLIFTILLGVFTMRLTLLSMINKFIYKKL